MSEKSFLFGDFVWFDMMTTDLDQSLAFYSKLFPEWDIQRIQVMEQFFYHKILVNGRETGGFVPMEPGQLPSHWISYVSVPDCDATTEKAESLGGKQLVAPFTAPGVGRMSVIADPQGAYIKPFALEKEMTPLEESNGNFVWCELLTNNTGSAVTFYEQLFGWGHAAFDMGPMGTYISFRSKDRSLGGALPLPPDAESAPCWLPYLAADDVDERTALVVELGGKVKKAPSNIPETGRFSVCSDPNGASFALYKHMH